MSEKSFCLIGHPLGHTMSPFIHEQLFASSGVKGHYGVMDIAPDRFDFSLASLMSMDGFNITIPYKQRIIQAVNRLDRSAKLCGAVNTVSCGRESVGYNTDMYGFIGALEHAGISLCDKILICGAGGAARAVAFAAALSRCELLIAVRRGSEEKGELLCREIAEKLPDTHAKAILHDDIDSIDGHFSLAVNATPVGMYPHVGASVLTEDQILRCNAVYDLIYNPRKTELIKIAEKHGIKCDSGMSMLVMQAAKSHEIWYGAKFDNDTIAQITADAEDEMQRIFAGGGAE